MGVWRGGESVDEASNGEGRRWRGMRAAGLGHVNGR
jgi:hypothetical protein